MTNTLFLSYLKDQKRYFAFFSLRGINCDACAAGETLANNFLHYIEFVETKKERIITHSHNCRLLELKPDCENVQHDYIDIYNWVRPHTNKYIFLIAYTRYMAGDYKQKLSW